MPPDKPSVVLIAGEASADVHGASLANALRNINPDIRLSGIGSTYMRQSGVTVWEDLTAHAVIGFIEVLRHLPLYRRVFHSVLLHLQREQPQAIILIDFPGFNLRLASAVKKRFPHIKIIYYISPQVWAWGRHRVNLIRKVVDHLVVVFKFEEEWYRRHGITATFVGHPLLETVCSTVPGERIRTQMNIPDDTFLISMLPGSRRDEIRRHLPLMLAAGKKLLLSYPQVRFALIKAAHLPEELYQEHLDRYPDVPCSLIEHQRCEVIAASDFAWVCSGTATLETAILGTPMVVLYRTSFITWLISRTLVTLPAIGLVNIVAGGKIAPELIQFQASSSKLVGQTRCFLQSPRLEQQKKRAQLSAVRERLLPANAAENAARHILTVVNQADRSRLGYNPHS